MSKNAIFSSICTLFAKYFSHLTAFVNCFFPQKWSVFEQNVINILKAKIMDLQYLFYKKFCRYPC